MKIFRWVKVLWILLMLLIVTVTYRVKYDVQKKIVYYHELQQKIEHVQNQIHLMLTEWSLMSQPNRLEKLSDVYSQQLQLRETEPFQFVEIKDLP